MLSKSNPVLAVKASGGIEGMLRAPIANSMSFVVGFTSIPFNRRYPLALNDSPVLFSAGHEEWHVEHGTSYRRANDGTAHAGGLNIPSSPLPKRRATLRRATLIAALLRIIPSSCALRLQRRRS